MHITNQDCASGSTYSKCTVSGVNSLINSAEPDCLCVLMNEYETELRVNVCQALLERTGYTLDVTTGQRKYGGPPSRGSVLRTAAPASAPRFTVQLSRFCVCQHRATELTPVCVCGVGLSVCLSVCLSVSVCRCSWGRSARPV